MIPIPIIWYLAATVFSRIILFSGLVAATTALAAGCGGGAGPKSEETVVAGFYPLAFAAEQIAVAGTAVKNLTPAGAEPHPASNKSNAVATTSAPRPPRFR